MPYLDVNISHISVISGDNRGICTGIAPKYEGGMAACVPVQNEYLLSYTSTCSVESGIQCAISIE